MEVLVLNLADPDNEANCEILNLLNTVFSSKIPPDKKKKILSERYHIAMTAELKSGVQTMCNLSTAIADEACAEGRSEDRNEGFLTSKEVM